MTCRLRACEQIASDGPWIGQTVAHGEFPTFYRVWRSDFVIEVLVLGHWVPGHTVLASGLCDLPVLERSLSQRS